MIRPSQIPNTGRKPLFLVRQLGFDSVPEFASSLPKGAIVVDIGAGLSLLGQETAGLRADIHWINIDPGYSKKPLMSRLKSSSPSNLVLLAADITSGTSAIYILNGKADFVFSYWLLPHLSLETDDKAKIALQHMFNLLKPNGKLSVGPIHKPGFLNLFRYKGATTYSSKEASDSVIAGIVSRTKLWWLPRIVQRFSNRHNIHIGKRFVGGK